MSSIFATGTDSPPDDDQEIAGLPPGYRSDKSVLDPYKEKDLSLTGPAHYRDLPYSQLDITKPGQEIAPPTEKDPKGRDIVSVPGIQGDVRAKELYREGRFGYSPEAQLQTPKEMLSDGTDAQTKPPDDENPAVQAQKRQDQIQQKYAHIEDQLRRELERLEKGETTAPPQVSAIDYQGFMQRYDQTQRADFRNKSLTFLAIAVPLALAFGLSGRGSIWQAMGALGEGMTALVKGHDEQRKEKFEEFAKYATYARELSNDKIRHYEEVLRDQHTTSANKVRILSELAKLNGDEAAAKHTSIDQWIKNVNDKKTLLGRYSKVLDKTLKTVDPAKARAEKQAEVLGHKPNKDDQVYQTYIKTHYGFDPYDSPEAYQKAIMLIKPEAVLELMAKARSEGGAKGRDQAQKESDESDQNQNPDNLNLPGAPKPSPSPTPSSSDATSTLGLQ